MAILHKRRHPILVSRATQEASKADADMHSCPKCGNDAKLVEKYTDRSTYKCVKCKAESIYTRPPTDYKKIKTSKGPIIVRDMSKQRRKETKKPKEEEHREPEEDNDQTPKGMLETVGTIRQGLESTSLLGFEYTDSKGQKSKRNVEGYKLAKNKNGELVLWGYCVENEGIRVFKLSKIRRLSKQPYTYKPRWPIEDRLKDAGRG